MKTIAAATLGCKVNQYDTEAILEAFERAGLDMPRQLQAEEAAAEVMEALRELPITVGRPARR